MEQSVFAKAKFLRHLKGKWWFQRRFAYWFAERSARKRGKPMVYNEDAYRACSHWIVNPK